MIRACKKLGYSGAVITDHFFNGNCAVRGNYSWRERVKLFLRGYENAKREGDKIGIDVYFGFEYGLSGSDFLIYNFSGDKLLDYPEIMTDSFAECAERIHGEGGFIIHAHPFRVEPYILQPGRVIPELTDAVEILNTSHWNPEYDRQAKEYAENYNLYKIGGSDTHHVDTIKSGIAFARKPESLEDIINLIKQNKYIVVGEKND
jgi:predicted metal-dependent phosphoesterase TrpH